MTNSLENLAGILKFTEELKVVPRNIKEMFGIRAFQCPMITWKAMMLFDEADICVGNRPVLAREK
jgi:DNA topoisomerase IB